MHSFYGTSVERQTANQYQKYKCLSSGAGGKARVIFHDTDTRSLTTGMHPCHHSDEPPEKKNQRKGENVPGFRRVACSLGSVVYASVEKQSMVAGSATMKQNCLPLRVCMFYTWCVNGIAQFTTFWICTFHLACFQGSSM